MSDVSVGAEATREFRYAVLIPARDEETNLPRSLGSMVRQTVLPVACMVLDDGSTDGTPRVVAEYAEQCDRVLYHRLADDGSYTLGSKIMKNFGIGIERLAELGVRVDWIIKMDADIAFEADFMEQVAERVRGENYGLVSGQPYILEDGERSYAYSPLWHTNGDFKIYRAEFLRRIGSLPRDLGWDAADNILALEAGYLTTVFRDVTYEQLRPIGRQSLAEGRTRAGRGVYKLRYSLLYILLRAVHDVVKRPYVVGSLYYLFGWASELVRGTPRTLTPAQGKILRGLLWGSLPKRLARLDFAVFRVFKKSKSETSAS